jgi:acetolactate synthase-1/2/3 large subunit
MIRSSTKPIILIGAGVARGGATHVVRKLVEKTGFSVVNTFQGKGVIPEGNTVGFMDKSGLKPIKEADLIIAIGYGQVEVAAEKLGLNGKKIINISVVETSADPIYIPDIELVGNIETIVAKLTQKL